MSAYRSKDIVRYVEDLSAEEKSSPVATCKANSEREDGDRLERLCSRPMLSGDRPVPSFAIASTLSGLIRVQVVGWTLECVKVLVGWCARYIRLGGNHTVQRDIWQPAKIR